MKFRILEGRHTEAKDANGKAIVYLAGEVLDSKSDLRRLNQPNSRKFERVDDDTPVTPKGPDAEACVAVEDEGSDGLDDMTVGQLRTLASERKIDLGSARAKEQIIDVIRSQS